MFIQVSVGPTVIYLRLVHVSNGRIRVFYSEKVLGGAASL